jgi:zinc transport system substrate-binding protein
MEKLRSLTICILVISLVLVSILTGCSPTNNSKLKVVTSTSLLAYIAQQVGDDLVDVINLIPPTQHPGDFNVKPSDIEKLANARLFLLHGWPGEGYADKMIASAANPNLTVFKANVNGNWMTPPVQLAAIDKVENILSQVDTKNASAYLKSAEEYKQRVATKESDIKAKLVKVNISQVNVIASGMQADFLKWAGLNVVATYIDPKSLTPQIVKELVDQGKEANVSLIVDNLQNGKDAGKAIAEELGIKAINLSNFPGGFPDTDTWEKAIDRNVELILEAIAK